MTSALLDDTLVLPEQVTVERLDAFWMSWSRRYAKDLDSEFVLDLSASTFIDPVALLHVVAIVRDRQSRGATTRIRLPESQQVRDFLRAWRFPEGVYEASGARFYDLVHSQDTRYFGEPQRFYVMADKSPSEDELETYSAEQIIEYLESRRFFGLMIYDLSTKTNSNRMLDEQHTEWREPLISKVLNRHLRGPGSDVARVHIFELLANAIQHPKAEVAGVVSSVQGPKGEPPRWLTISVWDDGEGIVETLRAGLRHGHRVRVHDTDIDDLFVVDEHGHITELETTWEPSRDEEPSDAHLLVASFFPGISERGYARVEPVQHPDSEVAEELVGKGDSDAEVGMGLCMLYRSVLDTFGGTIAVRSDNLFMNVKRKRATKGEQRRCYKAKVVSYDTQTHFPGNMITLRIPTQP